MDAHAHLKGLGWRGTGYSLDKNDRGLKRPLLISHKNNLHGLGSKSQKEKQADQWWLNAFDNALKDIGSGKETTLQSVREHGVNRGGLYGHFVKGQVLESTIKDYNSLTTPTLEPTTATSPESDDTSSSSRLDEDSISTSSEEPNSNTLFLGSSSIMGGRRNGGGRTPMRRNTNTANGANSMPLGNNRMLDLQRNKENEHDKKRKRSEEPADVVPEKPGKKAKGADGAAIKPSKTKKVKKEDFIGQPEVDEKLKKVKKSKQSKDVEKSARGSEPMEVDAVAETMKEESKQSNKSKKIDEAADPIQINNAIEPVEEKVKKSKKERKRKEIVEVKVVPERDSRKSKKTKVVQEPIEEDLKARTQKLTYEPIAKEKPKKAKKEKVVEPVSESSDASSSDESSSDAGSGTGSESDADSDSESDNYSDVDTDTDSEFAGSGNSDVESDADESDDETKAARQATADSFAKHPSILKVVDGIAIPVPEPIIREKKKKIPAKVVREQRKKDRAEKAKQNALVNKKKAIEEGTFDFDADEKRRKERMIDKMCKQELNRRENAGEFGPKLPHPSVLLKIEKDILKELKRQKLVDDPNVLEIEKKMMHAKLIEMGVTGLNQNRKVKYKEEKYKREKLKREAAREIKARERHRVFGTPYTPADLMSEYDKKKLKEATKEKLKAERRENRAKRAVKTAEKEAEKAKCKEEKIERRKQSKENRKKTAEAIAAQKAQKAAEEAATAIQNQTLIKEGGPDMFAGGADEIKLGINIDGRQRTIPGVGKVERYPTKAEKLRTKIEARAFEAGITFEEMKAQMDKEKQDKLAPEKQRVAELQKARGGLTSRQWHHYCSLAHIDGQEEAEKFFFKARDQNKDRAAAAANGTAGNTSSSDGDVVKAPVSEPTTKTVVNGISTTLITNEVKLPESRSELKPLSDEKKERYAVKAAKKGISVEEYIKQHNDKKTKGDANGASAPVPIAAIPNLAGMSFADKLLAAARAPEESTAGFIVDTAGDPHLNNTQAPTEELGFIIDTSGDPEILTRPKAVLKWHPDMLGDRKVKELSKEERRARLEWMRERRAARHNAEGKTPMSKKERHKARVEKKQRQRNKLVAGIMSEKGKPREEVSKEELDVARREAKKIMREEKRLKRNKVIHRKKLGGGLRGQFGGSISIGGRS